MFVLPGIIFMNTESRIAKNTILMLISLILTLILGFFITTYTARYLGVENFGIISLALSITGIYMIFTDLGLNTLIVREIARDKSFGDKYTSNILLIKLLLTIMTLILIIITVSLLGYDLEVKNVIYIITFSIMISTFTNYFGSVFQANQRMLYVALYNLLTSSIILIGVFVGIYYKLDLYFFTIIYLISNAIVFIYMFQIYVKTFSFPKWNINLNLWKPLLKEAWPFGLTSLSGMIYTYIDTIMLSVLQGSEAVGLYSAAYRIMLIMLFFPNAINLTLFPVMSKYYKTSKKSLQQLHQIYFKYMLLFGLPIGFGTTILANKIITFIFGQGYLQSGMILQILIWTIVLTFIGASFVQILQSTNNQLVITKISVVCVFVNIVINLFLIPLYSYIGASIATVITEVILVGYCIFYCYKINYGIKIKIVINYLSKFLVATLSMSVLLLYINNMNLFIQLISGTVVYFVIIYLINGIDEEDKLLVNRILGKN